MIDKTQLNPIASVQGQVNTKMMGWSGERYKSLRTEVDFIVPYIKATSEVEGLCVKHNQTYNTQTHHLPTGRIHDIGCSKCETERVDARNRIILKNYMDSIGTSWYYTTNENGKKEVVIERIKEPDIDDDQPFKKAYNRYAEVSKGY